jgi:alpha-L-fucosidase
MAGFLPAQRQLRWQELEFGMFCHFGVNTFTGREWGDGTEDPAIFVPGRLDCGQWARAARRAGMRYAVLTAKHHDGFCLWPTETTRHSVRSSPWRDGRGDVVAEFVAACRAEGLVPGLYCSPWDRNAPCYPDPAAYSAFYARQLEELLGGYGPLGEVWFDGAGSQGYVYDWAQIMAVVRRLQPEAVVFNMGDPDVRWGCNEAGYGDPDLWTVVDAERWETVEHGAAGLGRPGVYLPAEMDTTINRAGGFWHAEAQGGIKSLDELLGIYYRSVGHGANLLLNLAPNRDGLLEEAEVARAVALGAEVDRRFGRAPLGEAGPGLGALEIALPAPALVQRFEAMEDLRGGESVLEWVLEAQVGHRPGGAPAWHRLAAGRALGHRRLGDIAPIRAQRFRLWATRSRGGPGRLRGLRLFGRAD